MLGLVVVFFVVVGVFFGFGGVFFVFFFFVLVFLFFESFLGFFVCLKRTVTPKTEKIQRCISPHPLILSHGLTALLLGLPCRGQNAYEHPAESQEVCRQLLGVDCRKAAQSVLQRWLHTVLSAANHQLPPSFSFDTLGTKSALL